MKASSTTDNKILLVEDEKKVCELVEIYLSQHGFQVDVAATGEQALKTFPTGYFDLVVLDLNLPGLDGLDVLKKIRRHGVTPVIVVSARSGGKDRVKALQQGADDYLTKPYYPEELLARIHALLRRARLPSTQRSATPLELKPEEQSVLLYGVPVSLTEREYALLHVLASEPGKLFSRMELFQTAWGRTDPKSVRRVDLYISRLRARIQSPDGTELIESVYGKGYRFGEIPDCTGATSRYNP